MTLLHWLLIYAVIGGFTARDIFAKTKDMGKEPIPSMLALTLLFVVFWPAFWLTRLIVRASRAG